MILNSLTFRCRVLKSEICGIAGKCVGKVVDASGSRSTASSSPTCLPKVRKATCTAEATCLAWHLAIYWQSCGMFAPNDF